MRSLDGQAKNGDQEYEVAKEALLDYLKNRTITPIDQDVTDLSSLKY